jgi:diketogulonate reductase-like aldo/keto reductase
MSLLPPLLSLGTAGLPRNPDIFVNLVSASLTSLSLTSLDSANEDTHWYQPHHLGTSLASYCSYGDPSSGVDPNNYDVCANSLYVTTKIPPWKLGDSNLAQTIVEDELERYYGGWYSNNYSNNDEEVCVNNACNTTTATTTTNAANKPRLGCVLIHAPTCWEGWHPSCSSHNNAHNDWKETWLGLEMSLLSYNTTRCIGISNFRDSEVKEMISWINERKANNDLYATLPMLYQGSANPYHPPPSTLLKTLQTIQCQFQAYSMFGQSVHISGKHEINPLSGVRTISTPLLINPVLLNIAQEYEWSVTRVILEWGKAKLWLLLARSSNPTRIQEYAALINEWESESYVKLREDDVRRIDELKEWRG